MENVVKPKAPSFLAWIGNYFKRTWRAYVVLLLVAGVLIAFDQWTKALVRNNIPTGNNWLPNWLAWLDPYARIVHWYNAGAAFGLFQGASLVFAILAVIVAGLILYFFPRLDPKEWWLRLALAMQFSGAVGNLIDRIRFNGQVTDFISVGNFAVFNVADSCITVGTAILLLGIWLKERADKRRADAKKKMRLRRTKIMRLRQTKMRRPYWKKVR